MFHRTRQRMRRLAGAEAAGESFWTEAFSERVRTRIFHRWTRIVETTGVDPGTVFHEARATAPHHTAPQDATMRQRAATTRHTTHIS